MDLFDFDCDYKVTSSKKLVSNLKEKYKFNKDLITHFLYDIAKEKGKDGLYHGNNFDIFIDSEKLLRNGIIVDYFIDRDGIGHYTYDKQFYTEVRKIIEILFSEVEFSMHDVLEGSYNNPKLYPLVQEKYDAAGFDKRHYKFINAEEVKQILDFDFREIHGFNALSDEEKILAEKLICNFINGWGLEYRETDSMHPVLIVNERDNKRFKIVFKPNNYSYLAYNGEIH